MNRLSISRPPDGMVLVSGRLLSGDYEATRQHNLLAVLLSSPVRDE
jgi:hypothetical protein